MCRESQRRFFRALLSWNEQGLYRGHHPGRVRCSDTDGWRVAVLGRCRRHGAGLPRGSNRIPGGRIPDCRTSFRSNAHGEDLSPACHAEELGNSSGRSRRQWPHGTSHASDREVSRRDRVEVAAGVPTSWETLRWHRSINAARARVRIPGHKNKSRTFDTQAEAEVWARRAEATGSLRRRGLARAISPFRFARWRANCGPRSSGCRCNRICRLYHFGSL
jgi:hypothetical protein